MLSYIFRNITSKNIHLDTIKHAYMVMHVNFMSYIFFQRVFAFLCFDLTIVSFPFSAVILCIHCIYSNFSNNILTDCTIDSPI